MARRSQPTDRKAPLNELAAAFCLPLRGPGVFPRPGTLHFLDRRWLDAGRPRTTSANPGAPLIMGVAIARDIEDQTVIRFRQGLDARSIPAIKFYLSNPLQSARRIMEQVRLHQPAAVFVDSTGTGCAVYARLAQLDCPHLVGVDVYARPDCTDSGAVCSTADGQARYHDKRAEMWGGMKEWLNVGRLPDDPDLLAALASVECGYDGNDAIQLERKYDVKLRGLPSPDDAEALALTFAYPVAQRSEAEELIRGLKRRVV
jgi:hypothetical protein